MRPWMMLLALAATFACADAEPDAGRSGLVFGVDGLYQIPDDEHIISVQADGCNQLTLNWRRHGGDERPMGSYLIAPGSKIKMLTFDVEFEE